MKDPPPVFSPASQSVTLPSLKSGWRFIKRETEQANKTTDRPFLPTLLSQDRGRERNSSVVHFFFFFHFFQRKRESSFWWIQRTKRKKKKERKNWNSYNDITRCTDVDPRELIHAPGASRPIVHGWTASFPQNGNGRSCWSDGLKRDAKIWRVNESPNAPRIIAPLLIQIRERASSSSSSPPRRRAYCNTSFENSHHWVPHPWGACSRVTLVT